MKHEFTDIEVKQDAPRILEEQLRGRRRPGMITTGAMCDPYVPIEEELALTRQCLALIEKYGFGVSILTKSPGILRDLDILRAINARAKCVAQMTLTTYDEDLCGIIEPGVSSTFERFKALETMRDEGIPTVVWLSPILPFINDTEENLRGIMSYCVRAKVRAVMCFGFGMTLRGGSREYYYRALDRHFPGLRERYTERFGGSYECLSANNGPLTELLRDECRRHGMLCGTDEVFAYLRRFETKGHRQTELF
jgi:DNA repair photolyase